MKTITCSDWCGLGSTANLRTPTAQQHNIEQNLHSASNIFELIVLHFSLLDQVLQMHMRAPANTPTCSIDVACNWSDAQILLQSWGLANDNVIIIRAAFIKPGTRSH